MTSQLKAKVLIKQVLGRFACELASMVPATRPLLNPIGMRCAANLCANRIVKIELTPGRDLSLAHLDRCYLAFQLFWQGIDYYEPITRVLLTRLVQPGATFVDVGAHMGFFSLVIGLSNPLAEIIAFEPNPANFHTLLANVSANNCINITCEASAISDREGTATLYLTHSDMSASLMKDFQSEDTEQIGSLQVTTASLDNYLERHPVTGPLVIKVDMEGHEPAFFSGARATLAKYRPDIVLEILYDLPPELVAELKELGYHFYPITDESPVEEDSPHLVKRYPFLFLNHLLSTRPKQELATVFEQVRAATAHIDLRRTSKHFPKERWPLLWQPGEQSPDEELKPAAFNAKAVRP